MMEEETIEMFPNVDTNEGGKHRKALHTQLSRARSGYTRAVQEVTWFEAAKHHQESSGRWDQAANTKTKIRRQEERIRHFRVEIEGLEKELCGEWAPQELPTPEQSQRIRNTNDAATIVRALPKAGR